MMGLMALGIGALVDHDSDEKRLAEISWVIALCFFTILFMFSWRAMR